MIEQKRIIQQEQVDNIIIETDDTVIAHKCARCGYVWILRADKYPRICPECKSPYWDGARV